MRNRPQAGFHGAKNTNPWHRRSPLAVEQKPVSHYQRNPLKDR